MKILIQFLIALILFSCESKPKVIVEDSSVSDIKASTEQAANGSGAESPSGTDVHQVTAIDVLQADRYTYIEVSEVNEKFWIAVPKQEIIKGKKYYYRGGLKKTNFPSKEFNRTFDVIYLVGKIIDADQHPSANEDSSPTLPSELGTVQASDEISKVKGVISLKDLFSNKSNYQNKQIRVQGKCIKANYNIMGKNWYHIEDGTMVNGKKTDLTITSMDQIQLGDQVAFEGVVTLNKDFGAGYTYEIIVENAKVIK